MVVAGFFSKLLKYLLPLYLKKKLKIFFKKNNKYIYSNKIEKDLTYEH